MHKIAVRGLFLTGVVALALSGCGMKPTTSSPEKTATGSTVTPAPTEVNKGTEPAAPKSDITAKVKAYYSDDQGNNLVEKEVSINYKEEKDKYTTALWTLKKAPVGTNLVPLADSLGFKSAVLQDKKLTLDVTVSDTGRLGSGGEMLLIEAIKKTLFQFQEVDQIEILVNGKQVESLMGHVDLPHPIRRK